jgi:hypothetical protein
MTTTLLQTNGSQSGAALDSWLTSSVQSFFHGINWEDNPPNVQKLKWVVASNNGSDAMSLTLSVQQFFAAVNWNGAAIAAPVAIDQPGRSPQAEADNITLEDFSNLF